VYLSALSRGDEARARGLAFSVLVISELLRAFSWRSDQTPVWRIGLLSNRSLVGVVIGSLAVQLCLHQLAPLRGLFHLEPLSVQDVAWLLAAGSLPALLTELAKLRWSAVPHRITGGT
jgi:Ca2+-transporting ATPase